MYISKQELAAPLSPRDLAWRFLLLPFLLPACGILLCGVVILVFGRMPFLFGFAVQALYPRRLPALLGILLAAISFIVWQTSRGPFLSIEWMGSHPVSLFLELISFLAFFFAGAASFRGWRYQRFEQRPGWFMIWPRFCSDVGRMSAQEDADRQWHDEAREAIYEDVGFHPRWGLDRDAIVARGGNSYGHYYLYKCPECGHPFLIECEADGFHLDLNDLSKDSFPPEPGQPMPCPECEHEWIVGHIANHNDGLVLYRDWLITPQEIQKRGLDWIVQKKADATSAPDGG